MRADTLAKLLYEWERPDRPPADQYRLPARATVIVDEAGMLGTGALDRLIRLTVQQRWRLALVGDPYQLQAVGRGGMFHELCTSGRTKDLEHIYRFRQSWEAAASLQLRHGDPAAVDTYIRTDASSPASSTNTSTTSPDLWLDAHHYGKTLAVTAATNEHVDAINDTVQAARVGAGQLDSTATVAIGHGHHAHPGDVIVTRRNNRQIHTTTGEPIRNRELWTITGVSDGALNVTSRHGAGDAVLPADYAVEHVQLGYAATEHGNQSDTVDIGIELVTASTGRRGLYVGATSGRDTDMLLVVTNDHDANTASDLLQQVLANDRADTAATAQHRNLAQADRRPDQPTPRCQIPASFYQLQSQVHQDLAAARTDDCLRSATDHRPRARSR